MSASKTQTSNFRFNVLSVTGSSYLTVNSSLALDVFQIEIRGGGCPREAS